MQELIFNMYSNGQMDEMRRIHSDPVFMSVLIDADYPCWPIIHKEIRFDIVMN